MLLFDRAWSLEPNAGQVSERGVKPNDARQIAGSIHRGGGAAHRRRRRGVRLGEGVAFDRRRAGAQRPAQSRCAVRPIVSSQKQISFDP
jgi:hypothetical protein